MGALETGLRKGLESAVIEARRVAEAAAGAAIDALAVREANSYPQMNEGQRRLRTALRARAKQLGEGDREAGSKPLVEEIAYEQWHQMLFARFLAENDLLMHPAGVAVTLEECEELAAEEGEPDGWAVAAKYASRMLPGIFRVDDPATQVQFAPESRLRLEELLTDLPKPVFTASDSLGWVYQFWQTEKKKEVNASGRKIGGADLPPVTQLFTENYMVRFLLENSLGAWWAGKHPESPLLGEFSYLRYLDDGTPAAGTFPGWPETVAEVTVMDPCCGSGHFLVEAFDMLTKMRMEEEGLGVRAAGDAVLRDNLFGLEIDPRCTQIAAFAIAFATWKSGGYREIPIPNIACSGIPVQGQLEEWKKLASGDGRLENALTQLHRLYIQAPELGSLIDPNRLQVTDRMFTADYSEVAPLLEGKLAEVGSEDPVSVVFGASAAGVARANEMLAGRYTLVATNVPYLGRGNQAKQLRNFAERYHPEAKAELATMFFERARSFSAPDSAFAVVTTQVWLFLGSYKKFRRSLLETQTLHVMSRLGPGAFETISGEVVNVALLVSTNRAPRESHEFIGIDATQVISSTLKAEELRAGRLVTVAQNSQLDNPDARIALDTLHYRDLLAGVAASYQGVSPADRPRFGRFFWEILLEAPWVYWQGSFEASRPYDGCHSVLRWDETLFSAVREGKAFIRGEAAWGKVGVVVKQMGILSATLYTGERWDTNVAVIVPKSADHLPALWAFCRSPEYNAAVRQIDQKKNVTNATLVKVPFDLEHWQKVAEEQYPDGLPEPYSNDPTQWLFKGRPDDATEPLQVAVGRLLGYRWPEQEPDDLDRMADDDGIVPLPAIGNERPAAERLRALLAAAFGSGWSTTKLDELLTAVDFAGKSLDDWLLNGFFQQHVKLFHNRPFIWHIWDGRKDGFSALVNYHMLDGPRLERLIYSYLGDWILLQRAERDAGIAGADGRLVAALELQKKLIAIFQGEAPHDIYVRWKPLHEQPIGWNPDLNDGVRLNIRPWIAPWGKPSNSPLRDEVNVHWGRDSGKNPDGSERHNDLHRCLDEKRAAREQAGAS